MAYEFKGSNTGSWVGGRSVGTTGATIETAAPARAGASGGERSLAQILSLVFGLTFLLVGVAGFIPGVTRDLDQLRFLGTDSNAELLGLFRVSTLHNIVHALFGVGILAAARPGSARAYLLGGGLAYALVVAYGAVVDHDSEANFLPVNDADNLLHAVLTLGMLAGGVLATALDRRRSTTS